MIEELSPVLIPLGRLLLGGYFFVTGVRSIAKIDAHATVLAGRGVPQPRIAAMGGIALMTVSGAMLGVSLWPAMGAAGLIVFIIAATVLYHNVWDMTGDERTQHLGSVLSNAALVGGLVIALATG
jgi:putative oxidoreductase